MAYQALVYINNTAVPGKPTKYNVGSYDLDSSDSERSETGYLIRNRVRQGIPKLELSYTVNSDMVAQIAAMLTGAKFSVRFYNPHTNAYVTQDMYVGDRSCSLKKYLGTEPGLSQMLWEYSFNLVAY